MGSPICVWCWRAACHAGCRLLRTGVAPRDDSAPAPALAANVATGLEWPSARGSAPPMGDETNRASRSSILRSRWEPPPPLPPAANSGDGRGGAICGGRQLGRGGKPPFAATQLGAWDRAYIPILSGSNVWTWTGRAAHEIRTNGVPAHRALGRTLRPVHLSPDVIWRRHGQGSSQPTTSELTVYAIQHEMLSYLCLGHESKK